MGPTYVENKKHIYLFGIYVLGLQIPRKRS